MSRRQGLVALVVALAAVALLAFAPRTVWGLARPRGPSEAGGWYSIDPDGLYHTRRVARALEEGLVVAGRDPYLNHPHGAAIPWPPYYDGALALALAPFAPADAEARRPWLEHAVATLPVAFGILTALLTACAAWWLLREAVEPWHRAGAAAFAGIYAASGWGAINYSTVGTGDHHAWVGMLHVLLLLLLSLAFATALRSTRRALVLGALCGALAALLLGSWVAALEYVGLAQLALGWLLVRRAGEELPGAAALGLALHLAALALIAPAVLQSPWKDELPWMVVDLSWFHLAWLALGTLVFLPPALLGRGKLASGSHAARRYPLVAAAFLLVLAGLLWVVDAAPARGVAEGFAWVSRVNSFMDTVKESAPLLGPRAAPGELFLALGVGVVLVPLAWGAAAWRALRDRADALLPWVVVTPVLVVQALAQKRFSDAALPPIAVMLAWGGARWLARTPAWSALPLALVLALSAHFASATRAVPMLLRGPDPSWGGPEDALLGERSAIEWLRTRESQGVERGVLAHWDRGHVIEWAADRPTVATNFGSYVGIDSYRDPARFFLQDDPRQAEALLQERSVGHVLVSASLPRLTASMCRIAGEPQTRYLVGSATPTQVWHRTMLARLLEGGRGTQGEPGSLGFLRLVHVSTRVDPTVLDPQRRRPRPAAFVWERVSGAVVERPCSPGESLELTFELDYPAAGYSLVWRASGVADGSGVARVRVPYATDIPDGDGRVRQARWTSGPTSGPLAVPEHAVVTGATVRLE